MAVAQLTVLGAGLIGGSVCLAARQRGFAERIVAIDRSIAPERGDVADLWVDASDRHAVEDALRGAELTVLCMPVRSIVFWLPQILDLTTGWVTDCGSTKVATVEAVRSHPRRARFVPGHPMAGHPEGGLAWARADLFRDKRWILCPEDADTQATDLVRCLAQEAQAHAVELTAQQHDHSVAFTSHLPQVVASTLSVLVEDNHAAAAAGPGFASATRVAGGAEAMWRDIFETNGTEISSALATLAQRLEKLSKALETRDPQPLLQVLERARHLRHQR